MAGFAQRILPFRSTLPMPTGAWDIMVSRSWMFRLAGCLALLIHQRQFTTGERRQQAQQAHHLVHSRVARLNMTLHRPMSLPRRS
jgi:hypothetical protein